METRLIALRTVKGREKDVAEAIMRRIEATSFPVKSIIALDSIPSFVFLEVPVEKKREVYSGKLKGKKVSFALEGWISSLVAGINNVRAIVSGGFEDISSIEHFLTTEPIIEELKVGDIVKIIKGPLKDRKARILSISEKKGEVIAEILDTVSSFTATLPREIIRKAT